ncbi:beta-ketoacyl-ACP synthase 3 [Lusitaniella coriacea LEGE 07157]|uniref:Beta-ketoacyl-[acyl-carrier-protein] synthase III n=1 Tax=Lusitaniella coriacea LEGE 07157 TaxID=945747 RepID=A0A8J7DVE4_9CYAN|nr:beta-ketoacyl-ACP synthase 3 [Lusitaniella coriacea]MBE9115746.1 beta-ketoacyl-ACP synthase 3 [Lusitaniella coriacea LEGE 07157]
MGIAITGSGSATPTVELTNESLSQIVETSDEWISSRTGIQARRLAGAEESLCELAAQAAQNAIAMAQLSPTDIDLIVLATSTPDDLFGSAVKIQHAIGATQAVAFDLTAACSGFVFGVVTAAQFIYTGAYRNVVVIGADILSRWVNWSDRATCVLFGDGAGAMVLQADESRDRLLGFELASNGTQNHCLNLAYRGESQTLIGDVAIAQGTYQPITMNGREVYRFAVAKVPEILSKVMFRANLTAEDINWLILHQANQRIMDAVAQRLGIPAERVVSNLAKYGNTSAASIPIALDEAVRAGKIQTGDILAVSGFGAGLTWGGAIFEWGR